MLDFRWILVCKIVGDVLARFFIDKLAHIANRQLSCLKFFNSCHVNLLVKVLDNVRHLLPRASLRASSINRSAVRQTLRQHYSFH